MFNITEFASQYNLQTPAGVRKMLVDAGTMRLRSEYMGQVADTAITAATRFGIARAGGAAAVESFDEGEITIVDFRISENVYDETMRLYKSPNGHIITSKVQAIKYLRAKTGAGLKEAKDMVELFANFIGSSYHFQQFDGAYYDRDRKQLIPRF